MVIAETKSEERFPCRDGGGANRWYEIAGFAQCCGQIERAMGVADDERDDLAFGAAGVPTLGAKLRAKIGGICEKLFAAVWLLLDDVEGGEGGSACGWWLG